MESAKQAAGAARRWSLLRWLAPGWTAFASQPARPGSRAAPACVCRPRPARKPWHWALGQPRPAVAAASRLGRCWGERDCPARRGLPHWAPQLAPLILNNHDSLPPSIELQCDNSLPNWVGYSLCEIYFCTFSFRVSEQPSAHLSVHPPIILFPCRMASPLFACIFQLPASIKAGKPVPETNQEVAACCWLSAQRSGALYRKERPGCVHLVTASSCKPAQAAML